MIKRTKRGFRVKLGGLSVFDFAELHVAWTFAAERMSSPPIMRMVKYPIAVR